MLTSSLLALISAVQAHPEPAAPAELARWLDSVVLITTGPSLCAGVLIDAEGTVATAYHCVASGRRSRLRTRDGVEVVGRSVAADARGDLALISAPELAGRPWLPLYEGEPMAGQEVWALGHPFGTEAERSGVFEGLLQWSVSRGVISAVGPEMIQVDAPMNPGNSGGPIVDAEGHVVGIASRKLRGDNLGFIAPAARLRELVADPKPRRIPMGAGLGLSATLPASVSLAAGVGVYGELAARDTLVLRADAAWSPDLRWQALALGEAWWPAGSLSLSARTRFGRGQWSTSVDLGGGVQVFGAQSARWGEERLYLVSTDPTLAPLAVLRLGFGSAAVRWLVAPEPEGSWRVMVGVDFDWPGTLAVF